MSEFLETLMLVCFGLSWPISVIKNYKAGTAKNMSLRFTLLIIAGCIFGIVAKIMNHNFNYVLIVYLVNLVIISLNIFVFIRNSKLDKNISEDNVTYIAKEAV